MGAGSKAYKPLLILFGIGLIVMSAISQKGLNKARGELGLTAGNPLENAPPVLAFTTVALGGFRGLIANVLWIRASDLQDEGKYFEMVQLADWITKLQPHFTTVWIHQAWNMAYNISIKFTDDHDRWLWILRGIELLRDEGLRYNPKEPLMYRELAWFFQHKIGHYLDDSHYAYKQFWILSMNEVLGLGSARPDFNALINPKTPEEQKRAQILREKYKMDPKVMQEVDQQYGPLEWRLPETSAIYWAYLGLEVTGKEQIKKDDFIALRRVIYQSMLLAFQRGRLIYPKQGSTDFFYGPNLEIVAQTNKAYEDQMALEAEPGMKSHIGIAHRNFLVNATYFLYTHNRMTAAREWFNYLKTHYPAQVPASADLDRFALTKAGEDAGETDPNRTKSLLEGMLQQSFIDLAIGEDDEATAYDSMARKVWQRYQSATGQSQKRVGLAPFETIRAEVLSRLVEANSPLDPTIISQLRNRLNMPAAAAPGNPASPGGTVTNSPAGSSTNSARPR